MTRFFAGDRIDKEPVRLVRALRQVGLRVGLLSNAPPGRTSSDSPVARWGMEGLFDAQVFSYQGGVLKPDPRTYRAVLDVLAVPARETLLVDDSPANVAGAPQVGMEAVRFVGIKALLAELRRCGVPVPTHPPKDTKGARQ